jgi:hypothetical protein
MREWKVGGNIRRRAINAVLMQVLGGQTEVCIEVKEQIDHLIRDN